MAVRSIRTESSVGYATLNPYFKVKTAPHALNLRVYVSGTPENRVEDLHTMFRDQEVRAIVASIWGDHSCHLLPILDYDLIRGHPKIFMGYSDITVLNVAVLKVTGLVTFNGPMVITEFAEYPKMPEYSERYALRGLCEAKPIAVIQPSDWWTDEYLNWKTGEDLTRARTRQISEGWTWLRGGYWEGILIRGCIESLQHLRGTPYWPSWERDSVLGDIRAETQSSHGRRDNMGVFRG